MALRRAQSLSTGQRVVAYGNSQGQGTVPALPGEVVADPGGNVGRIDEEGSEEAQGAELNRKAETVVIAASLADGRKIRFGKSVIPDEFVASGWEGK